MAQLKKSVKGFYTDDTLKLFVDELKEAIEAAKAGEDLRVCISNGNSKMGDVASVSLMPFLS